MQGIVLETNVATIISELNMNCTDTFYLSMIIHGICIDDTLTKGFILTAPEVHFISNNVCLGSSTEFNAWVHPDCIELWQWNFGDGTIITGQNMHDVFHTYSSSGTFQASLTVYYHNGLCSVVVSHPVIVSELEKPEFSVPWEWACANEIVFTIENYDPSLHYFYTIDDPFAPFETLPVTGASSPLPQVEIPWPGMSGGIIYIHVLDDNGCYAYDSLVVFDCCFDASSGEFYYNHTFSGNQTMTGQSFYINGTIDFAPLSNYQFIDCNFYFSPNSKMIIPDFANVSIDKSGVLQACEPLMWDGIYVYGSGSLTISGGSPTNVLIQDAKHAVVSTDGGQFLIRKTTFDINYNHLAVFNYPCENHTGEIYASELLCTGAILPQYPPVVASKTRFAIELSIVKNITIGKSGGPHQRNLIENCDVGLYSRNSNVNVINNHFKNISAQTNVTPGMPSHPRGYGIYSFLWPMGYPVCPGNPPMFDRGISTVMQQNTIANYFTNCNRGIASYDNKIVNISKNKFYWDNNQFGAIAIDLLKSDLFGGYNTLKKVSANQISGYRFGIRSIVDHVLVEGNTIEKLYLPFSIGSITSAGIEVNGATDVIIKSNTVDNSSMTLNSRYEGVRVTQSYSTLVMCNMLKSLGKAIRFSGNCIPAEIKLNSMYNSIIGFCLSDTGFTGQQGMIGEPWDNKWYGPFTYHLYSMNNTDGDDNNNHWYISNQTGPKNPLGFYSWRDGTSQLIQHNATSGMLWPGLCAVPMLTFQVPYQPLLDEIALDQIPALQNPKHRRWMSKNGLIRTIDGNPNLMQSSVLSSFRTSQDFESTGQLIAIRGTVSSGFIDEGILLNDALVPVSEPDSLAKRINSILLNADYDNARFFADAFDNMAVSLFQQYAQLCPYVHGNHVYISRMLLQMIGDTTEYQNICEEETDIISEKAMHQINTNTQLKVYPNPTSNYITFETDMPLPCTLYLYNSIGLKIDELQIIENITILDIAKYKQQLIFYYINGISGKVSIIK